MTKLQIIILLTTLMGSFDVIAGEQKCNSRNCTLFDKMVESVDKELVTKCFKETGVNEENMRTAVEKQMYGEKEMCFHKCLATKTGTLESDGRINIDNLKEHLSPELALNSEAILACVKKLGPITACQHMAGMRKCVHM